ncbi:hypothetical protein CCH79_00019511 [Gambusia affinis]|uniref:Uncharacterized protein n=1 Tax=Gambusia affinis TaxID=33528 RepID=A0A315VIS9_GAMAF|nr:hypothetical protein CCH79_00019511 [Gambusia affinis]
MGRATLYATGARPTNESGSGQVVFMQLDLASLKSVRSFAENFLKTEPRLDILINNAGAIQTELGRNTDGTIHMIFSNLGKLFFKTPLQGSQTTLHCALQEGIEHLSGHYFSNCTASNVFAKARDDAASKKLWDIKPQQNSTGVSFIKPQANITLIFEGDNKSFYFFPPLRFSSLRRRHCPPLSHAFGVFDLDAFALVALKYSTLCRQRYQVVDSQCFNSASGPPDLMYASRFVSCGIITAAARVATCAKGKRLITLLSPSPVYTTQTCVERPPLSHLKGPM